MSIIPQDDTPHKQCKGPCNRLLPWTKEYFWSKSKTLDSTCKDCKNDARRKHWRATHPKDDIPEGCKRCSKCKMIYTASLDFFPKHSRGGLHPRCKKCSAEDYKVMNDAHVEYRKQYYQEHREEIRAKRKSFWELHKESLNERKRQYFKTEHGREISRAGFQKRRSHKKAIEGTLTAIQIQEKLKKQHYQCYYCSTRFQKVNKKYIYHLDHTIPISRIEECPRNDINFVVLACPTCNLKKRNRLPHEWPEGGRLF